MTLTVLAVVVAVVGVCVGYYYWEQPLTYSEVENHVRNDQLTRSELKEALDNETSMDLTVGITREPDALQRRIQSHASQITYAPDANSLPEKYSVGHFGAWESPVDRFLGNAPGTILVFYDTNDRVVGCIRNSQLND